MKNVKKLLKNGVIPFLLLFSFLFNYSKAQPSKDLTWVTTWSDNFNSFDATKWKKMDGKHCNPWVIQKPDNKHFNYSFNSEINNNTLEIELFNAPTFYDCCYDINGDTVCCHYYIYTTGELDAWDDSKNKRASFLYGYFEIESRMPQYPDSWPAFWLLGGGFEIDIYEYLSDLPNEMLATYHNWRDKWPCPTPDDPDKMCHYKVGQRIPGTNFNNTFHKVGLEWTNEKIDWYFDDILSFSPEITSAISDARMNLILGTGVGTWDAVLTLPDCPEPEGCNSLEINYVKYYERVTPDCNTVLNASNFSFENFDNREVKKSITFTNTTVNIGTSNADIRATEYILLGSGFVVSEGAEFTAGVIPCP